MNIKVAMIICLPVFFGITGCAFHSGSFMSGVSITNNQFKIAGEAIGTATTFHVFEIGGLSKTALVYEARKDLMSRYPIAKGMGLANVSVDFKRTFFLFFIRTRVTIIADIIDFNPSSFEAKEIGFYTDDSTFFPTATRSLTLKRQKPVDLSGNIIQTGSNLSFEVGGKNVSGRVIEINSYGVKCLYDTPNGKRKIYLQPIDVHIKSDSN